MNGTSLFLNYNNIDARKINVLLFLWILLQFFQQRWLKENCKTSRLNLNAITIEAITIMEITTITLVGGENM